MLGTADAIEPAPDHQLLSPVCLGIYVIAPRSIRHAAWVMPILKQVTYQGSFGSSVKCAWCSSCSGPPGGGSEVFCACSSSAMGLRKVMLTFGWSVTRDESRASFDNGMAISAVFIFVRTPNVWEFNRRGFWSAVITRER